MTELSKEQQEVVGQALSPLSVVACAGSGKTLTAIHRVAQMRSLLQTRGRVALLSFSNVAVDTFRGDYQSLVEAGQLGRGASGTIIETMDSFITTNVLRPHGHRTMGCARSPYLVTGNEPFLSGFTFPAKRFPQHMRELNFELANGQPSFYWRYQNSRTTVPLKVAQDLIERAGRLGAYTHDLGRYWTYRTLREQPAILRALAARYPHIVVDEAQDIGTGHQAILELLLQSGVCISLIGDPNQGIYEFAGADGAFLREYGKRDKVQSLTLTLNYRSVPLIVGVANALSARGDTAHRTSTEKAHGALYTGYGKGKDSELLDLFRGRLAAAGIEERDAVILFRGGKAAEKWRGDRADIGQGATALFAAAAIHRDRRQDFHAAYKSVIAGVAQLVTDAHSDLAFKLGRIGQYPELRALRRLLWGFTRDAEKGLPSATLTAETEWHPALLTRVRALLAQCESQFGIAAAKTVGLRLSKKGLENAPLIDAGDLASQKGLPIRVETVHQVKGESIRGVMYVATKDHVRELLTGTATEVGRIGYVAVTRAKDLFLLAMPSAAAAEFAAELHARGFKPLGG